MIRTESQTTKTKTLAPFMRAEAPAPSRAVNGGDEDDETDDDAGDGNDAGDGDDAGDADELELRSMVERQLASVRQSATQAALAAVRTAIREATRPNRSRLPAGNGNRNDRRPAGSIRVSPAEEYVYRMLPAAEREWRKPETDHYIAEWIRGMAFKDRQRVLLADDHLARIAGGRAVDRAEGREESRADTLEGTTTAVSGLSQGTGGALIPLPFAGLIIRALNKSAKLRARATVYTSDALTLRVSRRGVASVANALEGAVAAQGEPTFDSKLLTKKKTQANMEASYEMLEDSAFNLVSLYSEAAGEAFGEHEDLFICTSPGTGADQTESFASATITAVAEAVSGTCGLNDLSKIFFDLPQQYRDRAVWMTNSTILGLLSVIRPSGGMPLLVPQSGPATVVTDDGGAGVVGFIFGKPVIDVPTETGQIVFGDPRGIGILDGGGIRTRTYDIPAADSIGFRFTRRWDCVIQQEARFRQMEGITTAGT